jgi:hypothetical protein
MIDTISDNNVWKFPLRSPVWDRNYTDDVVEVIDDNDRVADLGNAVNIAGILRCENGGGLAIHELPNGAGGTQILRPSGKAESIDNPKICKYPSETHLGECLRADQLPGWQSTPKELMGYRIGHPIEVCAQLDK